MVIKNTPFPQIEVGFKKAFRVLLSESMVRNYAMLSRDCNPTHLDTEFAMEQGLEKATAHRMLIPSLLSGFFGNEFPGPGTQWMSQTLNFHEPAYVGDNVTFDIEVTETSENEDGKSGIATVRVIVTTEGGKLVASGLERLLVPTEEISVTMDQMPMLYVNDRELLLKRLLARATLKEPATMAVAWPMNKESLEGAVEVHDAGLVIPVLFGPENDIRKLAEKNGIDLGFIRIVNCEYEDEACEHAAKAVGAGEIEILMKGSPHTDNFLKAILNRENRLRSRSSGTLSHVFYIDGIPPRPGDRGPRSIVVTDGALIPKPDLVKKAGMIQNAIDFFHAMGMPKPKVAVLAAVEVVNPEMQATIDAACLKVMAERGQIKGGIVDGPLAFDVAMNPDAVKAKGIVSEVAGRADVLVGDTLETSNVMAKEFEQAKCLLAGVLIGANCPVVLTSRTDDKLNRLASVAIAVILLKHKRENAH